jgi:hypothetical protein
VRCFFCGVFSSHRRLAESGRRTVVVQGGEELSLSSDSVRSLYRLPFGAQEDLGHSVHARESDAQNELFRDVDV